MPASARCCAATPTWRSARATPGRPTSNSSCSAAICRRAHPAGGMTLMDDGDYADMVEQSPVNSVVVEYREPSLHGERGRLVGACLTDQQADGLSMIYSFFIADEDRAPGPRQFHHHGPHHARARCGPALRLSRLLGEGVGADGVQDALSPARGARARTAGRCWPTKKRLIRRRSIRSNRRSRCRASWPNRRRPSRSPPDRARSRRGRDLRPPTGQASGRTRPSRSRRHAPPPRHAGATPLPSAR